MPRSIAEVVRDAQFLFLEESALTSKVELCKSNGSAGLTEAHRIGKFHTSLPFLIIPFEDVLVDRFEGVGWGAIADPVIPKTTPAIDGQCIESWTSIQACGHEFQFTAFDGPFCRRTSTRCVNALPKEAFQSYELRLALDCPPASSSDHPKGVVP